MLRNRNLIPLSHQHQRALAMCVRIDRAQPIPDADLLAWQAEIEQHFEPEIRVHFAAEESELFPVAREFPGLSRLADELAAEHSALRESFSQARGRRMSAKALPAFAQQLSAHIRKEERQLFEGLQQLMSAEELATLGMRLKAALKGAEQSCSLPNQATRLKAKPGG